MTMTLTVGGSTVAFDEDTFSLIRRIQERQRLQVNVLDYAGVLALSYNELVVATDSDLGVIFAGYLVDDKQIISTYPDPTIIHQLDTVDARILADNRTTSRQYVGSVNTGKVVVDLWNDALKAEGILANAAIHEDATQADFATGTLAGVVSTLNVGNGDLELPPTGTMVSFQQITQSDFNAGTTGGGLTALATGGVTLTPTQAIKLAATETVPGLGNAYVYVEIWNAGYTIASGDVLQYDVWDDGTSPVCQAAVDFVTTTGLTLRDNGNIVGNDLQGIGPHPSNDLSGLAKNQWYARRFLIDGAAGAWVGKIISYVSVAFEGQTQGNYAAYFRNIRITNGASTKVTIFGPSATSTAIVPKQLQTNGYNAISCTVVASYERYGWLISPAFSLAAAGIVSSSYLNWNVNLPTTNFTFAVSAFVDGSSSASAGASLACTNNSAIPGLLPGMSLASRSLLLVYEMTNNGNDPTLTPLLSLVDGSVQPSYACTKSDVLAKTNYTGGWSGGTLNNLSQSASGFLQLAGYYRSWNDANFSNQTLYGAASPVQAMISQQFGLTSGTGQDARSRLDFAGSGWQNFIMECDIIVGAANTQYCLVYRTTGWQNANNTFAYMFGVTTSAIQFGYGTNTSSGAGSFTSLVSDALTLISGDTHRLKAVVNGNSHQFYLDDVLYINQTDSTYPGAGYVALRTYNSSGSTQTAIFDNFGIVPALSGTWVSPAIDIHALSSISNSQVLLQLGANFYPQSSAANTSVNTFLVEISLNNGSTWTTCVNTLALPEYYTSPLPGLSPGTSVSSLTQVLLRITITSTSIASGLAQIAGIAFWAIGAYSSSGTRTTVPMCNDMSITRTVGSGWGTAFDGQAWTQTGTGTTAVATGEETIANTSGDVHMSLPPVGTDVEATVRFQLSAATILAGLELRYTNASNYYRLAASTTATAIIKNTGGGNITLKTVALSLSTGVWYRMRFRCTGSGPVTLQGKVWADGLIEPGDILGMLSTTNPEWTVAASD